MVNHRRDGEAVEVFEIDIEHDRLLFRTSVTHPLLRGINDVLPLSASKFLVTNWLYYEPGTFMYVIFD